MELVIKERKDRIYIKPQNPKEGENDTQTC